ncbi:MAG: iron-siderophore ABC transporter substrate-binding protein [Cyanobacteria bacterium P01_G01_bin.39]
MLLWVRFLVVAAIALGATASCQSQANRQEISTSNRTDCRTVEHKAGETEVCGQPERIVVLGDYFLESLLSLGLQPVAFAGVVAFHQGDYDNPSQQIPYLGNRIEQSIANVGTAYEPSIEAIAKVQPDLIVANHGDSELYEILSQIAPTISLNRFEPKTNLKAIAVAVNRSGQAEQLLTETEQRINAARKTFAPVVAQNPKLLLFYSGQLKQIVFDAPDKPCYSLPQELGFQLVSLPELERSQPNSPLTPISIEKLPQLNDADLIIVLGINLEKGKQPDNFDHHQLSKIKQAWQENAIAQSLDASKVGRVYFIPAYLCGTFPGAIGTELYLEELEQQLLSP